MRVWLKKSKWINLLCIHHIINKTHTVKLCTLRYFLEYVNILSLLISFCEHNSIFFSQLQQFDF